MAVTAVHWERVGFVGFWAGAIVLFLVGSLLGGEVVYVHEQKEHSLMEGRIAIGLASEKQLESEVATLQKKTHEEERLLEAELKKEAEMTKQLTAVKERSKQLAKQEAQDRAEAKAAKERLAKEKKRADALAQKDAIIEEMYMRGNMKISPGLAEQLGLNKNLAGALCRWLDSCCLVCLSAGCLPTPCAMPDDCRRACVFGKGVDETDEDAPPAAALAAAHMTAPPPPKLLAASVTASGARRSNASTSQSSRGHSSNATVNRLVPANRSI
eukprot:COSAG01_NODE_208_length_21996_cov_31.972097_2_plen_270_part_00